LERLILKLIASHVREKPVSAALAGFLSPETATNKKGQHFLLTQKKAANENQNKNRNNLNANAK